jgi:lysozyme
MKSLIKKIKEHEGYRASVYQCTEGYDTIGYGFAIKDLELTEEICDIILAEKLAKLQFDISSKFQWFDESPELVKDVVTNMCYQLGLSGFSKFKKTIYYLETEQYEEASIECLDSLWAKQTPNRAKELSEQLASLAN